MAWPDLARRAEEEQDRGVASGGEEQWADCNEEGSSSPSSPGPALANGWGAAAAPTPAAAVAQARPLALADFERVLESFRPSGVHAQEYRQQQASNGQVRATLVVSVSAFARGGP